MKIRRSGMGTLLWCLAGLRVMLAQPQSPVVSVALDKGEVKVAAGAEFRVVLNAAIAAGWHINSDKPNEESLIPTTIDADGESISLISVEYPKARQVELGISENPLSVFEGHCQFILTLKTGDTRKSGRDSTAVILHHQACNDRICMPPTSVTAVLIVNIEAQGTAQPRQR